MIEVPMVEAPKVVAAPVQVVPLKTKAYKILCLDNDETILEGMATLLSKWGYHVFKATEPEQAIELIQREHIQVWLVDQHLNDDKIGLDFILEHRQEDVPVALITADSDPELPQRLKELNIVLLKKPLKPASLRSWLSGLKISGSLIHIPNFAPLKLCLRSCHVIKLRGRHRPCYIISSCYIVI